MGDTRMTPIKHRDVVDRLRERLEKYTKHHSDCQTKQERSQALREDQERREAMLLHKRAIDNRTTKLMNVKGKQQDPGLKSDQPPNGLEMKSTTAILQRQILKRKFDQGLNNSANIRMNCDKENGQVGESLSKYQRTDDIHNSGLQSHEHQMNLPSSQHEQQSKTQGQLDSLESLSNPSLGGGHFVGDGSNGSSLLTGAGVHSASSDLYTSGNRIPSPNSLPPTEFKREHRQVAVSCDGGRLATPGVPHETLSNGVALANSARGSDNNSTDAMVGQELQQQLNDFERVLQIYTNSTKFSGAIPLSSTEISEISQQHRQLQRPTPQSQIDNVTRDTRTAQQSPTLPNPSAAQKHQYTTSQQAPPGPTALHLQQLARQAQQSRRAQASGGYMDGQEQDTNLNQFRSHNMQFLEAMRLVASVTQQQVPSQGTMQSAQFSAAGRFRTPMPTVSEQYASIYASKEQNQQGIMSTGFPTNTQSLQYQRMVQSQVSQQVLYRLNQQQNVPQRLSHPTIQEQQTYQQQYQAQQAMSPGVPQNMPMQNLPAYSSSGYQAMRSTQTQFHRQHSVPLPSQGYPSQEQYTQQQMQQYQVGDQQVPTQQQTDMNAAAAYHYNRRNSFPLYHRTMSQPVGNYMPGQHNGYSGQLAQMRNNLHGQNPANAMLDSRANAAAGYTYDARTSNMAAQPGVQGLVQLPGPQRGGSAMTVSGAGLQMQQRTDQPNMGYGGSLRDMTGQAVSQDLKYPNRNEIPKVTRGPAYTDSMSSMALADPSGATVSAPSSDSQFSTFSPLAALEKVPSFTSLLEQSSGSLTNLETTYTGSIPNLDLLGEIIG